MGNGLVYLGGYPAQPDGSEQQKQKIIKKNVWNIRKMTGTLVKLLFDSLFLFRDQKHDLRFNQKCEIHLRDVGGKS